MSDIRERLKSCTPRELYMEIMPTQFQADPANKEKLAGFDCTILMKITGEGGGAWTLHIKDGHLEVKEEEHAEPSMGVEMAYDDWRGITTGTVNPQQAFMEGKMVITGDMSIAMQLGSLFQPPA